MSSKIVKLAYTQKKHINLITCSHCDAGASTLCGRLLYELGELNDTDLMKLASIAREYGKESFVFAFYMDKSKDERARGITIQCHWKQFFTESYHYTIIDTPSHFDFISNMFNGASQGDVAILVVPANKGGFETAIARGNHKKGEIQGLTRAHARICHLIGIKQMIVCINKMDECSVNYDQRRFNEIKFEVEKMLTKIGYKTKRIPFIPISAFKGDNLTKISEKMKWYKGFQVKINKTKITGYTLLDALENAIKPPKRYDAAPLMMTVDTVYHSLRLGLSMNRDDKIDIVLGKIDRGTVKIGDKVKFYPSKCTANVVSIEMHHKRMDIAKSGDNAGIRIEFDKKKRRKKGTSCIPKVGDVMVIDDGNCDPRLEREENTFCALIFVQDHPGKLRAAVFDEELQRFVHGYSPIIYVKAGKAPCQMIQIKWKMGKSTNNKKIHFPEYIEAGDSAKVVFEKLKPMIIYPFRKCSTYGRIACFDQHTLIMLGEVIGLLDDELLIYGYIRNIENKYRFQFIDDIKNVCVMYY